MVSVIAHPSPLIIVCGLGRTGYRIFSLLRQQGAQVVGIHDHPLAKGEGSIITGHPRSPEILRAAGIESAYALLITYSDDALNLAILTQATLLNPRIRIINRLFNARLGERLDQTLPHHTSMSVAALAAPLFAFAALGNRAIGQIQLFDTTWPMHEEVIDEGHPWAGKPLKHLWNDRNRMLIYYISAHQRVDLITAIIQGRVLQPGDRLILATHPQRQRFRKRQVAQFWQRCMTVLSQFRRRSRATLFILLALMMTIAVATLTYLANNPAVSVVDALYFSVGMITGAGGQEAVAETSTALVKVFTVVMMLVGAGVIGICYALLNDFILGAHFQALWNVARMPQQNHYIICGLGGVGYQIVTHLHENGYEVVVVERDPNGRFIQAVRALNIPVIVGDASLAATLETVNIQRAGALLAVTSDDTVNLEIALTAKSQAPKLAIVARTHDPDFAHQVQQVFEFEQVMSPTELAAPAFAAAALGGRILGNGMTGHQLWVAIATLITPNHPFCGKPLYRVAQAADLVPLYIESQGKTIHGFALLDHLLQDGDILYLTLPATRLKQIWSDARPHLSAS